MEVEFFATHEEAMARLEEAQQRLREAMKAADVRAAGSPIIRALHRREREWTG
jgi:hypothetical protein